MRIDHVETIHLRVPAMDQPCEWGEDAIIVKITTDTGLVGYGESDSSPLMVQAAINAPQTNLYCTGLKELILGEDPLQIQYLWDKMYWASNYMGRRGAGIHAMSAIDIALWDIASQHYQVPIHMLLGGKYRDKIRAYGTFIPGDTPEATAQMAKALKAQGFTSLKFGGGIFGDNDDMDVAMVHAVREELGPDFELQIDLASKWGTYGRAAGMFNRLAPYQLNWIEEPILADDLDGYARLATAGPGTKRAGGESLTTRYEFAQFLQQAKPDIVQPDITRCGGISEMRIIGNIAEMAGTQLVPHGFSTGILLSATVQYLAATKDGELMEYSQSTSPLFTKLVRNILPFIDGYVTVPDCLGLGVELDDQIIEQYRVPEH